MSNILRVTRDTGPLCSKSQFIFKKSTDKNKILLNSA